ncbi:MAG: A/G-specific adenine glycosylase [Gammaproteobacteria bacterium]
MNPPPQKKLSPPKFRKLLLTWFDKHGRHDLPWQQDISAYRVWISEIMLQQTQVTTVIDYFNRFMQRFPDVTTLAQADIDEVLHLWSGLGYYARGRNLHKAAQIIFAEHGGELPTTLEEITTLPGIGRSTGGAILAIAHGKRHAILDGNVKRVLTRLQCIEGQPDASATQKILWPLAESLTPTERVADYTQAIMDLGATLCTRSKPACEICPVTTLCAAYRTNTQDLYPTKKQRKKIPTKQGRFLRLTNPQQEVLLYRRPPVGIWGGLWCLPEIDLKEDPVLWCHENGLEPIAAPVNLPSLKHTFTHYHFEMLPIEIQLASHSQKVMDSDSWLWYNSANPTNLGLAKPMRKLILG